MVQKIDLVRLDTVRLGDRIREQDIKLYWLADDIHVDKRTVSRWVNGRVKWIKQENLEALTKVLLCDKADHYLQ